MDTKQKSTSFFDKIFFSLIHLFYKERVRIIYTYGEKYLLRVYIRLPSEKHSGIFLHRFYTSDKDAYLHNHPWKAAKSFILCGRYLEDKLVVTPATKNDGTNFNVKMRTMRLYNMFDTNQIDDKAYHKVTLINDPEKNPVWTLFFAKEKTQDWGFWNSDRSEHIPWNEYYGSTRGSLNYVTDYDGNRIEPKTDPLMAEK